MDVPASPDAPEVRPPRLLNELRPRDGQNDEEHDEVVPGGVVVSGPGSRPLWSKQTSNTLLKRLQASAGFLAGKENASVSGKRKIKRKLIMDYDDLFRMEAGSIKHRKTSFACMSSSSSSTTTSSVSGEKASPKRSSRASAAKSNCCQNQKPSRTGGKSVAAIKPRNSHYDAKKKGFVKMEATSGSKIKSKKTPSTNAKKSGEAVPVSTTITKVASVSEKGVYVGNRRYYHVRCNQIMSEGQVDDWDDFNWLLELSLRQIDDFLDVNEGEKTFFKLWNEHVFQMPCYGDAMMPECLDRFVDNYAVRIHRLNVYRNFLLHLSNLYDFGVISQATVLATILRLQNLIKNLMLHPEQQQLPPPILYPVVLSTPYVRHDHEPAIPNLLDDDDDDDGDCGGRDQPQKHIYQNHEAGSPSGSRSGSPHHHHNNNNNNISIKSLDSDRIVPMLTPSGPIASTSFSSASSTSSSSSSSWSASSSGLACSKSSGPDSRRQQKTFWRCGRGSLINSSLSSSSSLAAASSSESGSCSKKKRKVEDLELLLDEVKYRRKRVCVSFAPAQQTPPIRDLHSDSSSWSSSWSWDSPYVRPCVRFSSGSKKRCSL